MRLPGTRYQEPGWERVRKLLGAASLTVLQAVQWQRLHEEPLLDWYCEAMAVALQQMAGTARAQAAGNSYGDNALALAQSLVCELRVLPSFWQSFVHTLPAQLPDNTTAWLRKKVNDMYVSLRDRVDADQYQIAIGRACSANKIYTCRMLDTAWHEIAGLLADWRNHAAQLSAILDRPVTAQPIESRRVRSAADCDPNWIIRWSASLQQFGRGVGPLHTQSKRFSSLKNNPDTIRRILAEMGEYETISALTSASGGVIDQWQADDARFDDWAEDYWRVIHESEAQEAQQCQQSRESGLPAVDKAFQSGTAIEDFDEVNPDDGMLDDAGEGAEWENSALQGAQFAHFAHFQLALEEIDQPADTGDSDASIIAALQAEGLLDGNAPGGGGSGLLGDSLADPQLARSLAEQLSLPPDYMAMASASEDRDSLMYRALQQESLSVRLALYSKQLGAWDESYPEAWLDPATGELPSMKQLAALDQISLPTLRKRRDLALQRLQAAREQCIRG